jgi:hypothetical protein
MNAKGSLQLGSFGSSNIDPTYLGPIAGGSVPATATDAGDYYIITTAGTSQGKTWAVGDRAVYEGTSGNWTQVPAQQLFGYNAPTAISAAGNTNLTLAAGQAQRVEKVTVSAGSAAYTATLTLQSTNAVAGYEIQGRVSVAASFNPLVEIRNLTSGGTLLGSIVGDSVARVWNFTARFDGTNWFLTALAKQRSASIDELNATVNARAPAQGLVFDGTAGATVANVPSFGTGDFTVAAWVRPASIGTRSAIVYSTANGLAIEHSQVTSGAIAVQQSGVGQVGESPATLVAGKESAIVVSRSSGTTKIYSNGVEIDSFADATDYSTAVDAIGKTSGGSLLFSGVLRVLIYNRALTAAEVLSLYETGAPAAGDYNNASNTSLITGDNSTFASAGDWTVTGATTISGGKLNLSNGDQAYCSQSGISTPVGSKFKVVLTLDSITAGTLQVYGGSVTGWVTVGTTAGTYMTEVTFVAASNGATLNLRCSGGNAVVDSVTMFRLGLLLAPEAAAPGNGYQWKDVSGNKADITLPATGVAWALPDNRTNSIRGTFTWAASADAKYFLSSSIPLPSGAVLRDVVLKASAGISGTGATLGNSGVSNNYWVASTVLTTAKKSCTLANRHPQDTAVGSRNVFIIPDSVPYTGTITAEVFFDITEGM